MTDLLRTGRRLGVRTTPLRSAASGLSSHSSGGESDLAHVCQHAHERIAWYSIFNMRTALIKLPSKVLHKIYIDFYVNFMQDF